MFYQSTLFFFSLSSNLLIFSFHFLVWPADEARCALIVLVACSVLRYIGVFSYC
jgi:hypothetical protein